MTKVDQVAEQLDQLTLLEAAQLSKLLQEKWGVSAAAPMAVITHFQAPSLQLHRIPCVGPPTDPRVCSPQHVIAIVIEHVGSVPEHCPLGSASA